jgi:hypothetical protein
MQRKWSLRKHRDRREPRLTPAQQQERRAGRSFWLLTLIFSLGLWGILVFRSPTTPGLQPGYPSPVTIQARRTVSYMSNIRTGQARAQAETDPATVAYTRDTNLPIQQRNQMTDLLRTISQIRTDPSLAIEDRERQLTGLVNSTVVITPALVTSIVSLDDDQWEATRQLAVDLYDRAMREENYELTDDDVTYLRERSLPYWAQQSTNGANGELALLVSSSFLKANQVVDEEQTRQRKQAARDAVEPIMVQVLEGESIVREGDLVTPEIQEKLEALGELETEADLTSTAGRGIIAFLIAFLLGMYLRLRRPTIWRNLRQTMVIYALALITLLLARLVIALPLGVAWPYAFPLGAAILLLAALFDNGVALMSASFLSLSLGFIGDNQLALTMSLLLSCIGGVYTLGRANRSLRFVLSGITIGSIVAFVQLAFWLLIVGELPVNRVPQMLLMSAINGVLSAILSLGLYNLVGQLAGVVTPFQLMELAHPAQPLLRKLIREAPGTYYHSVAVGNLAESAAEAIGADALLLRIAAYYHDIGKAARPYFYTDNQSDRENVHNDLDPRTSAQIIADHVREGVNMAHSAGVPRQIVDFIPTHHGTSVIQHFYQMALRTEDSVDVADYSYPGPKPQTKEQAILMLADSVEATVRAKSQHGKLISTKQKANGSANNGAQTLEELVNSIIDERIRAGQLDESPLTLHDIAQIRKAFLTTLHGIYHPRTEYAPQIVKTS